LAAGLAFLSAAVAGVGFAGPKRTRPVPGTGRVPI
jgi:hypothetical protein